MQQHPSSSSLLRTDSPAPSSGTPGDMDCTIVVDPDNPDDQKQQQQQRQHHEGALPASSSAACLIQHDQQLTDEEAAAGGKDVEALPPPAAAAARPSRPRTYYIDWLRVFLTVLVVVHHCVVAYQSSYAWGAKKGDTALFLFSELFVNGNQAYFMTLFFFLSGLYVPGSYKRKGPGQFLLDRTLRLVVPCIFYSFLAPPFILWWNDMSKNPTVDPAESLGRQFRLWLKPGWPSQYNIATGPPWFIWMLWCFNVAYVVLKVASSWQWLKIPCNCVTSCFSSSSSSSSNSSRRRSSSGGSGGGKFEQTFSDRELMRHAGILTAIMFTICYAARILDKFAFNISPLQFYQRGPFMSFMPDLFPTYVVAFALGTYSGPSAWNVLARLPDSWGSWSLWVGGCWWVWAGWLINVTLRPAMVGQRGTPAWFGSWLLRTFVEQSFCVIWSIGLLVVFRRAYNIKPRLFGQYVINAAYGAYLVHMVVLILFARVIMSYSFPSAVVNAGIIALPSVVTSWLVAVLLRAIPGAHHVL